MKVNFVKKKKKHPRNGKLAAICHKAETPFDILIDWLGPDRELRLFPGESETLGETAHFAFYEERKEIGYAEIAMATLQQHLPTCTPVSGAIGVSADGVEDPLWFEMRDQSLDSYWVEALVDSAISVETGLSIAVSYLLSEHGCAYIQILEGTSLDDTLAWDEEDELGDYCIYSMSFHYRHPRLSRFHNMQVYPGWGEHFYALSYSNKDLRFPYPTTKGMGYEPEEKKKLVNE